MLRSYKKINIFLLILIFLLLVLTVWVWRGVLVEQNTDKNYGELETKTYDKISRSTSTKKQNEMNLDQNNSTSTESEVETNTKNIDKKDPDVNERLPKSFSLKVPFTPQAPEADWSQPWQDACEEATVLMLDAYYKNYDLSPLFSKDEILKMVEWEKEKSWEYSIEAKKIVELLEWYNKDKKARIIKDPSVEKIKELIYNGTPVLVVAHGKSLSNPYYTEGGPEYHTLVISGYTETEFITQDPGTKRGKNFKYKYEDLMDAIHDWNGGEVTKGEKVIIILE